MERLHVLQQDILFIVLILSFVSGSRQLVVHVALSYSTAQAHRQA